MWPEDQSWTFLPPLQSQSKLHSAQAKVLMTPDCLTKVKIWKSCFHRTIDICTDVFWYKNLNEILQSIYCFFFPNLQVIVKYLEWTIVIRYFLLFHIYLSIQKAISIMLRILIPVNNPKMPPKMINLFICTSNRLFICIMYHVCIMFNVYVSSVT